MLPTPIATPKHSFKNFNEARRWAKERIAGAYRNVEIGELIRVSNAAVDKYLSLSAVSKSVNADIHLSTLMQLPRLIEVATLRETQVDRDANLDIKGIQRFYGAILYEKSTYPVKITVKAYTVGLSKAYSYEVLKTESPIAQ